MQYLPQLYGTIVVMPERRSGYAILPFPVSPSYGYPPLPAPTYGTPPAPPYLDQPSPSY